ncbi:MAG: Flp pilus assembly protein CpaB [Pseudomonadota bacterium]
MKINRNWAVLGVSLVVGVAAALSVQRYIKDRVAAAQPRAASQMVEVVVANENLAPGTRLGPANVAVRKIPREWLHSNAIQPGQFDRAENAALALPAARGEPLLWAQLEGQRAASFSARLAAGRRAVTVPVDEISSISGMLVPGDAIDLIVALRREGGVMMLPLLQDVKVLATGTQVQPGGRDENGRERTYTTVTLDATPEEARRIMAAREVGRVTALLRAPGDSARQDMRPESALALLGLGRAAPPMGRLPVQVLYGGGSQGQAVRPLPGITKADSRTDLAADPPRQHAMNAANKAAQ